MDKTSMKRNNDLFRQAQTTTHNPLHDKPLWENPIKGGRYDFTDAHASDSDREKLTVNFGAQVSEQLQGFSKEELQALHAARLKTPIFPPNDDSFNAQAVLENASLDQA